MKPFACTILSGTSLRQGRTTSQPWRIARLGLDEIVRHLEGLDDPRSPINRHHPLVSVVVIALMAVLAGAGGPTSIADWAELKRDVLLELLDLPHGIPRKDVFRRVLMALRPGAFQACFTGWLRSLRESAEAATGVGQPVLAIDGTALRRSHDRKDHLGALHSVSAWAGDLGLSLGQVACEEKSNEITAIPELLRLVDIQGAIITIDAMGAQKAIAAQIIEGEADYVVALKGNHETLHRAVIDHIVAQWEDDFARVEARRHQTQETAHGREAARGSIRMPVPEGLPGLTSWKGLRSIGVVVSESVRDGRAAVEVRYYISSLAVGVERFARAIRGHWSIENGCHWTLDVSYREDESRIREPQLRGNLAWLNRMSLSLLKQHPGRQSIAMKRRRCGRSEGFLLEAITGSSC
jgi:predicted transposase YbfD/YdcC